MELETNGVAERIMRALRGQAIDGHICRTAVEVRAAFRELTRRHNVQRLVEKNGFQGPA